MELMKKSQKAAERKAKNSALKRRSKAASSKQENDKSDKPETEIKTPVQKSGTDNKASAVNPETISKTTAPNPGTGNKASAVNLETISKSIAPNPGSDNKPLSAKKAKHSTKSGRCSTKGTTPDAKRVRTTLEMPGPSTDGL